MKSYSDKENQVFFNKIGTFIIGIPFLAGIAFFGVQLVKGLVLSNKIENEGINTIGIVAKENPKVRSRKAGNSFEYEYSYTIEYIVSKTLYETSTMYFNKKRYQVGDSLTIKYLPQSPENSLVLEGDNKEKRNYDFVIFLIPFAVFAAFIYVILKYLHKAIKGKGEHYDPNL